MPIVGADADRYDFDPGLVLTADGSDWVGNVQGHFYATREDAIADTNRVTIYDTSGAILPALLSSPRGFCPQFSAAIPFGFVAFGANPQPVLAEKSLSDMILAYEARIASLEAIIAAGGGTGGTGGSGGSGGTGGDTTTDPPGFGEGTFGAGRFGE